MKKTFYFDEDYKKWDLEQQAEKEHKNALRMLKYKKTAKLAKSILSNNFGEADYLPADEGEPPYGATFA